MQITGEWYLCDDGIERPIIRGEVLTRGGGWEAALFLVDTGADRTVLSADILSASRRPPLATRERLGGLAGMVNPVLVETTIQLTREDGGSVAFHGQFAAVTELEA